MSRLPQPGAAVLFASILLLGLLVLPMAWETGPVHAAPPTQTATESTETPASTPTPTSSPTPSPPDAALAAEFARLGKLDEAIGAYRAVIDEGTVEERLAARFALGRVYLDDGQVALAARQLDRYLLEAPSDTDVRAAQELLAEALMLQNDWEGALPLYDAYIEAGGGASTYARLGRAEALARVGRGAEADLEGERVLAEDLPQAVRVRFILTMAQTLEESQPEEALVWYGRLRQESESPEDQALALWRAALIQRDLGDGGPLASAWPTIIQRYPRTSTAQAIVDDPPSKAVSLSSYYVGLVYYYAGRSAEAREAFEDALEGDAEGSLAARATFYLAVLDERAGETDAAVAGYSRVLELDSRVEQADDALWWQGRLLEEEGRTREAAASYGRLASEFAGSDWAPGARFRVGLLDYDGRRLEEAAEGFADIAEDASGQERQRALLWQGKALAEMDDDDAAEEVWQTLRGEAPADYFGLRAAVLLDEADGALEDAGLEEEQDPDWAAMEEWLLDTVGEDTAAAREALLYDQHWGLGQELLAIGMRRWAGAEFGLLLEDAGTEPAVLFQLARFFHSVGMADLSSRAATRLLHAVPEETVESAPLDLWRVAYPVPFIEAVREAADEEEAPDVLLLALVRQESFFDPLAGSSAGALGLTQVIPPTGEAIAEDLGVADFETEDLFRAALNLRFGAHYVREQMDAFDGNVYEALAAYNAGPGSASRWSSAAGGDVDRFVEEIGYSQTKAYVKLVMENLARYRQLYQDLEEPSLPED